MWVGAGRWHVGGHAVAGTWQMYDATWCNQTVSVLLVAGVRSERGGRWRCVEGMG